MAITVILFSFLLCTSAVYAVDHVVGDTNGWTLSQNYVAWAATQNFTVGDNLIFNYSAAHNVIEVDKVNYDECDGSDGIPHNGGPTTIALSTVGSKYFMCSIATHCSTGGMKLAVTVAAPLPGTPPPSGTPPTIPSPPPSGTPPTTSSPPPSGTPPTTSSPPPSGTPPTTPSPPASGESSPPPPPSGAPIVFDSKNSMLVGCLLGLTTLFAFMG